MHQIRRRVRIPGLDFVFWIPSLFYHTMMSFWAIIPITDLGGEMLS